jgi:hypothetical protein
MPLNEVPLGVGEIGVVRGDFHRFESAAAKSNAIDLFSSMKRASCLLSLIIAPFIGVAAENLPSKPFAQMVYVPDCGQWVITPWYQYTEFQKIWRGSHKESITVGDEHGFDQNNGMFLFEYSFKRDWAADLLLGYTHLATRSFTPSGQVQETSGLMDVTFGLRWQVLNETNSSSPFTPTLTSARRRNCLRQL